MNFPSKLVENAVEAFSKLPGIGKKTALRLVLFILNSDKALAKELSESVTRLREEIKYCKTCHNISDADICLICSSTGRDKELLCVVQDSRDVLAIENTGQYNTSSGLINSFKVAGFKTVEFNMDVGSYINVVIEVYASTTTAYQLDYKVPFIKYTYE